MAEASKVPYMSAYGNITKVLQKVKTASVPDRFTQDFLSTKLGLAGGSPKPTIPFLKRGGFLNSDGSPTDRYRQFRNDNLTGQAAADALKQAYASLYEINEYAHLANDKDLRGIIVQATGLEPDSGTVKSMLGSFKALREFADFSGVIGGAEAESETDKDVPPVANMERQAERPVNRIDVSGLRLGYTINLNLPATSDIAVFNAIFKSLRENLLN